MDISEALLELFSKEDIQEMLSYLDGKPERLAQLMECLLEHEERVREKAAWVMSHYAEKYTRQLAPYADALVDCMQKEAPAAVKRNIIRYWQKAPLPPERLGEIANICFDALGSSTEPITVKVFSMTVLHRLCAEEPDLGRELKILIEDQLPVASAGFRSRGRKILADLEKKSTEGRKD